MLKKLFHFAQTIKWRYGLLLLPFAAFVLYSGVNADTTKKRSDKSKTAIAPAAPAVDSIKAKEPPKTDEKLMVYYFRNNKRCPSCFKIENYSKAAVNEGFASDVKSGRMEWRMINVQEPGNEFYVDKYQIYTKTVILSLQKEGKELKWKNLDQIWDLLYDENIFKNYIKQGIRGFLTEK